MRFTYNILFNHYTKALFVNCFFLVTRGCYCAASAADDGHERGHSMEKSSIGYSTFGRTTRAYSIDTRARWHVDFYVQTYTPVRSHVDFYHDVK